MTKSYEIIGPNNHSFTKFFMSGTVVTMTWKTTGTNGLLQDSVGGKIHFKSKQIRIVADSENEDKPSEVRC